jgi:hypothetical protein
MSDKPPTPERRPNPRLANPIYEGLETLPRVQQVRLSKDECAELRAEVERLKELCSYFEPRLRRLSNEKITRDAEVERLRDEGDRLRAALTAMDQAIAGHPLYETSALQRQVQGLISDCDD